MRKTITALLVPILAVVPAFAGEVSASAHSTPASTSANNGGFSPYFGVSGVFGEFEEFLVTDGEGYDVAGVRINGGLGFGNGFSIDGRYEYVEGDLFATSIESDEFRIIGNYEQEIAQGLSLFGGIGYGRQSHEGNIDGALLELTGDGLLLNAGAKFSGGQLFGSLIYTHCITNSADVEVNGVSVQGVVEEEDLGYLEATVGYNVTEQLAATFSLETQVTGDTVIEKNWAAAIGLQYKF